jgi:nucleoside-diphosphate-sugar epimerase
MIVAITGATGFIGSRLVQKLLAGMQGFIVFLLVQYDMNTWGRALKFLLLASSD